MSNGEEEVYKNERKMIKSKNICRNVFINYFVPLFFKEFQNRLFDRYTKFIKRSIALKNREAVH